MSKERISLSEHFTIRKIIKFSLPSVLMMIFASIYSIVDGFFVSRFSGSSTPFAGLNFIYPYISIIGSFGFMFGAGGSALIGKYLGEGNKEKAHNVFSMINATCVVLGIILAIIGELLLEPIAKGLGAEGDLLKYALIYGRIAIMGTPFYMLQFMYQPLFIVAEKPTQGFLVTILAGVLNMVLDFVFIVLMHQHVRGAAIATVIGMIGGGLVPIFYFMRKNNSLLKLGKFHMDFLDLGKLCVNGLSEFVGQIAFSIVGIVFNYQLLKYFGENGVAAYGVLMYVGFIFVAMFIGYSTSISQVTSYHFGAQNKDELKSILKKSLLIILIIGVVQVLLAELLAKPISLAYVGYEKELYNLTVNAFHIYALHFLFCGFSIFLSAFFTALNDGVTSAIISFARLLIFQVALVFLFPLIWPAESIWWSIVAAEFLAVLLAATCLIIRKKKFGYMD